MAYEKAKKFIKKKLINQSSLIKEISLYTNETRTLINNLKNDKKISNKICNKENYHNEEIIIDMKNKNNININLSKIELPREIKECKLRYKIIYIIIVNSNFRHLNVMLIDNLKKTIEKFDTNDYLMSIRNSSKMFTLINDKIGLSNYKFIEQKKFLFSSTRQDCNLCVPLSLLYIYLRIIYELKLDDIISLFSELNNKDLFRISNWFINYLY